MTEASDRPVKAARLRIVDLVFARSLPSGKWAALVAPIAAIVAHVALLLWAVTRGVLPPPPPPSVEQTVELTEPPPPPPPPPPPVAAPPPLAEPTPPVRVARARVPHEAPPPPAQAGKIIAQEPDPTAPVDLGDKGFVTGTGRTYAGGTTSSSATSTQPVETRSVDATPRPQADLSSAGGLVENDWTCPWPPQADDLEVDEQVVMVRVTVRADGTSVKAQALRDPGAGFGAAAVACAERARFRAPTDASGKSIAGTLPPIRLRFTR